MKTIKWLWSITFAFMIVLFYATITSFFVTPFSPWYLSLVKDATVPTSALISAGWAVNYILNIAILTTLIYQHNNITGMLGMVGIGVLQIIWSAVFFTAGSLLGGLIIQLMILMVSLLTFRSISGDTLWRNIANAVIVLWYIATTIAGYRIFIIN